MLEEPVGRSRRPEVVARPHPSAAWRLADVRASGAPFRFSICLPAGVRSASGLCAQQLKLPVGSAHRLLIDLSEENVVERTEEGAWQLSYRHRHHHDKQLDGVRFR